MEALAWRLVGDAALVFGLTLLAGLLAAAETALAATRWGMLATLAEEGDPTARRGLALTQSPLLFPTGMQVMRGLLVVACPLLLGWRLAIPLTQIDPVLAAAILLAVAVAVALLQRGAIELVARRIAERHPMATLRLLAGPLALLLPVVGPLAWMLRSVAAGLLRPFGASLDDAAPGRAEIERVLDQGVTGGVLDPAERRMAGTALRLSDRIVRDIMQPRVEIDAMSRETAGAELLGVVAMAGFSRVPVYEDTLDNVVGFVHVKDVLQRLHMGGKLDVDSLLRHPAMVPETLPIDRLLMVFREQRTHLAIVIDEFGVTVGLVSLDNVLTELVGRIAEPGSRGAAPDIVDLGDGRFRVSGQVSLDAFCSELGLAPPEEEPLRNVSTVAGLVLELAGRFPAEGAELTWRGVTLRVTQTNGQRISEVLATLPMDG